MSKQIGIVTNGVHNNEFGGTHIYFQQMAKRWKNLGHNVTLFSYDSAFDVLPDEKNFASLGSTLSGPTDIVSLYRTIMEKAERFAALDAIHSDFWTAMPALCRISKRFKVPYIHECRGSLFNVDKVRNVYKWSILKLFSPSTMLFVDTKSLAQYEKASSRTNGVYVPVPIDLELFQPVVSVTRDQRFTLLYASWLRKSKGLPDLLTAMQIVWAKYPDTHLLIAGEGPLRNEVEALAESDERVTYLGNMPNGEMPSVHSQADLLVYPSYFEGFPRTILEACACGVPTVATEVGGLALLREKEIGRIVPPGNAKALAAAIIEMIDNPHLREKFAVAGQKFVKVNHSWDIVVQQTIDLHNELS